MENRAEKAELLHKKGYNCAQSVACAYCDLVGMDENDMYRATEGFGLGMGMMEICGALSGAAVLAGMQNSAGMDKPGTTKGATYKLLRTMGADFEKAAGSKICREIKGVQTGKVLYPCNDCIAEACRLVEEYVLQTGGAENPR